MYDLTVCILIYIYRLSSCFATFYVSSRLGTATIHCTYGKNPEEHSHVLFSMHQLAYFVV
jgi:hypothetical protein